ncbi:MAG: histidine kinase, partial [Bacteroidota bacterium]
VSVFLEPIDFQRKSIFSHDENNLVFTYTGLWYTDPGTVEYRYKLEGYDLYWIHSKDRQATYSNLPPGEYVFQMTSTENDAYLDEPIIKYAFEVKSPIWMRWWFLVLITLMTGGLLYLIMRERERSINRETTLKKEKIESQFEALKAQINPHFLFNSFNTLISIIEEDPRRAVTYVEHLSDFYRSILQYREKEIISLNEEIKVVEAYTQLLKHRYGDNLRLDIQLEGKGKDLYIAPLTLQMLVENAVKHNVISKTKPLVIAIHSPEANGYIQIQNNLQPKLDAGKSTGFGLQSIVNRYEVLSDRKVKIEKTEEYFKVSIPVIKS